MPRYRPGVKDTAARLQEASQFILKCHVNIQGVFYCSAPKMYKKRHKEKLKRPNCSVNSSYPKVMSVNPQ